MQIRSRAEAEALERFDQISVSVSHEIKINGDKSWVRYEATITVRQDETAMQAASRVRDHVDREVMKVVEQTVNSVNSVNGEGK